MGMTRNRLGPGKDDESVWVMIESRRQNPDLPSRPHRNMQVIHSAADAVQQPCGMILEANLSACEEAPRVGSRFVTAGAQPHLAI